MRRQGCPIFFDTTISNDSTSTLPTYFEVINSTKKQNIGDGRERHPPAVQNRTQGAVDGAVPPLLYKIEHRGRYRAVLPCSKTNTGDGREPLPPCCTKPNTGTVGSTYNTTGRRSIRYSSVLRSDGDCSTRCGVAKLG